MERKGIHGISASDQSTSTVFERNLEGSRQSRKMWIIGGFYVKGLEFNDLKALKQWSHNVKRRPMAIRGRFSSLEHFLGNKAHAYNQAIQFYRSLQKVSNGHSLNYKNFTEMLKETVTVASNSGIVHCPADMVVVAGFGIKGTLPMQIDSCIPSRYIYTLCHLL